VNRKICASIILASTVLGTGCVSVKSYPIKTPSDLSGYPEGSIPYSLPKTVFLVTDTITISCKDDNGVGDLTIKHGVAASPQYIPDSNAAYYIKPSDLYDGLKDSKVTVNLYPNQTLSSINGTANDLVGPTIAAVIGTAINVGETVGLAGIKVSGLSADQKPAPSPSKCSDFLKPDVVNALNQVAALKAQIAALQAAAKPSNSPAAPGGIPSASQNDPAILAASNQIADITGGKLTVKASLVWDPEPGAGVDVPLDTSALVGATWLLPNVDSKDLAALSLKAHLAPHIALTLYPWSHPITAPAQALGDTQAGFVLRVPAIATVQVCQDTCPSAGSATFTSSAGVLFQADNVAIGQFGQRLIVPFKDRVFENAGIGISLAADGSVTSIGTQQTSTANTFVAGLGTAAQSQAASIAALNTAVGQQNTAVQAAVGYPDLVNKSLADCLTQQKTAIGLGGTVTTKCQ
jgi:hypothetical protein